MPSPDQIARRDAVVPYAQAAMRRWGVPASISLAQWEIESGYGADEIAVKAKNCFGITHLQANHAEPYMEFRTPDYTKSADKPFYHLVDFVVYASVADSFDAHGRLLATSPRYRPAMAAISDVHSFARHLQVCGYSSAPDYAEALCRQIDRQGLTRYDIQPPPTVSAGKQAA